jgi:hypothetical protein
LDYKISSMKIIDTMVLESMDMGDPECCLLVRVCSFGDF